MPNRLNNRVFFTAVLIITVLKIFLVADHELFGQPYDDMGYARSIISHYYRSDPNLNWLFIRPIGFPLWGALCMETGIPYRICIELFFLGASAFFCAGLRRMIPWNVVAILSFAALAFHPWVLVGFNQLLTEPFFAALILLLLGICVRLMALEKWGWKTGWLWVFGVLMAYMMLTRREEPWAFGILALVFIYRFILLHWREKTSLKTALLQMVLILIPVGCYQATILTVSTLNYFKWGIFTTNEQKAPGFSGLLDTLYRIDTPDPSIWAPVTSKTLEMAIAASPRFAQLQGPLFNENNPQLEHGESTTGRKGELGAWMWWRLYSGLAETGIYTSPKAADRWMRETTAELQRAFDEGKMPERTFSTSFPIDPNLGIWLPEFPRLFMDTLSRLHFSGREDDFIHQELDVASMYAPLFDQAANRRLSILADHSVEVSGLAFSSAGRLDFVAVENSRGEIVGATAPRGVVYWKLDSMERLTGGNEAFDTAFYVRFLPRHWDRFTLSLWEGGNRIYSIPLQDRDYPHQVYVDPQEGRHGIDLWIHSFRTPFSDSARSMMAMLDGWAFTTYGPVTHVSLVNAKGQFLKMEPFKSERPDLSELYADRVGGTAETPLGFYIETPVLDDSPITVQFWLKDALLHEMPLEKLTEGFWGTIEETVSGVPITLGVGGQQVPRLVPPDHTLREGIRSHLLAFFHFYLLLLTAAIAAGITAWVRRPGSRIQLDSWKVFGLLSFLALVLLGRAVFYGLVEAAVVPGVNRYMDCASPLASLLLALVVLMALLFALDRLMVRQPHQKFS